MPISDDELREKAENVANLRQQLVEAQTARVASELELANDVTAAQLDAEAAQLEVELEREQAAANPGNIQEGIAGLMSSITPAVVEGDDLGIGFVPNTHDDPNMDLAKEGAPTSAQVPRKTTPPIVVGPTDTEVK